MLPLVALPHAGHYNARAQRKPPRDHSTREYFNQNATYRRLAAGRGVFVARGKRRTMSEAHEKSGASISNPLAVVLLAQTGLTAALAVVFWGWGDVVSGYSALLGGLTAIVPNGFLAARLMLPRRDPGAGALLRAAYLGELGKLVLTALMFGVVFALVRPLAAGALFAGFIVAQLATFAGFLARDRGRDDHGIGDRTGNTDNRNGD